MAYAILVVVVLLPMQSRAQPQHEDTKGTFLAEAYAANRDKFRSFYCRFHVMDGRAASLEDALAGRIDTHLRRNGIWVVHGGVQRYELACENPQDEKIETPKPGDDIDKTFYSAGGFSESVLAGDEIGIRYVNQLNSARLRQSFGVSVPINITPISMGYMGESERFGPGVRAGTSAPGGILYRRSGPTSNSIGGKVCEVLIVGIEPTTAPGSWRTNWLLDPDQGFLPIEAQYYHSDNHRAGLCVVTKLRKTVNGGFFPERSLTIDLDVKNRVLVTVIELDELRLEVPSPADFRLHLPQGIGIVKETKFIGRAKRDMDLSIGQLKKIHFHQSDNNPNSIAPPPGACRSRAFQTRVEDLCKRRG